MSNSFEKNLFTLGVFIDLSKAFDTVDHDILICKLKNYGIRENNLKWFEGFLNNQKKLSVLLTKTHVVSHKMWCPTRINIRTIVTYNLC